MQSTLAGVATGGAVGAASGAILGRHDDGQVILTSALVGAAIGGIAGYFTHQGLETRDANVRKDTLFNLEKYGVSGFYTNGPAPTDDSGNNQKLFLMTDDPKSFNQNNKGDK